MAQGIEKVKDRFGGSEALEMAEESLMDKKADINDEPAINETLRREYRHSAREEQLVDIKEGAPSGQIQDKLESKVESNDDLPPSLTHENPAMIF